MAGLNDLAYGIGTTTITIANAGGTLLIPQVAGVQKRYISPNGGTMFMQGASQAIGVSNAFHVGNATVPLLIPGPAAFILIAGTNGASVHLMSLYSQPGVYDSTKGT